MSRVPGAMQRSSRCFAEPGPRFRLSKLGPGSAAHHAAKRRRAALRPGNAVARLSFPREFI
jgi:hypothetical protein